MQRDELPPPFYNKLVHPLVGELLLVANRTHLTGCYYVDSRHAPRVKRDWKRRPRHPVLAAATRQLREYFRGQRVRFTVPLAMEGSAFQRRIWEHVLEIPAGRVVSYTELARTAGMPGARRAVGTALARCPLDIFIPAHRVVAQNGGLGGYAGKWNRKKGLLELEGHSV